MSETIQESEKAERLVMLQKWAENLLVAREKVEVEDFQLVAASDDASFRRYFRPKAAGGNSAWMSRKYVFVDAPPSHENNQAFLQVRDLLASTGVRVPKIYESDLETGYMMIENFGDQLCLDLLEKTANIEKNALVPRAIGVIAQMQCISGETHLPAYDRSLLTTEMNLFAEWFVAQQLKLTLTGEEIAEIEKVRDFLVESALEQTQVFVHRDFHSRNLMVLNDGELGVIDFQDAVWGPVTYDLVSLMKDCYFEFPREIVCNRVEAFRLELTRSGRLLDTDSDTFLKWFDLMGMQRHLKCAGIFSRLNLRDGKSRYLADIPLVINYILETCTRYPELTAFGAWLNRRIVPALDDVFQREID